jgi:membrane-associated phospholipid phosphatase
MDERAKSLAGGKPPLSEELKMSRQGQGLPVLHQGRLLWSCVIWVCALCAPCHGAVASDSVENAGSIIRTLIPAVAYGTTFYLHDPEGRSQFYKSFFSNLAVTYALKATVSKTRPDGSDNESFPSGHTSVAFQGAAFIGKRYGMKYGIPAYLGATFVAWSRVESDNHYTVDVLAGAAIGIATSLIFTKPYKGFVVTPLVDNGFYGVGISKQW